MNRDGATAETVGVTATKRLAAVTQSGLMRPEIRPTLDRMAKLVCAALRTPVGLVSLVEADRQVFQGLCGLPDEALAAGGVADGAQTPLSHSFCQHVVNTERPLVVHDARADTRVRDNLAVRDLGVIAYCGVPIADGSGFVLGSLCAIDTKPRSWDNADVAMLEGIALQLTAEVELRRQSMALAADLALRDANLAARESALAQRDAELAREREIEADRQQLARLNVHDLRTPLSAMVLANEMLRRLGTLTEEQAEFVAMSERNGQTLLNLLNNLIDLGAVDHRGSAALRRARCDAADLITTARRQVDALATNKHLAITTTIADGASEVFGDCDKLARVLVNLLANAVKFTPAHGRIEIHATPDTATGGPAGVRFEVRDTGIGLAANAPVFEEGVRLDPHSTTPRSAGLGLTFCKRIIEAHAGRIGFTSTPGRGSTFWFTLPSAPT